MKEQYTAPETNVVMFVSESSLAASSFRDFDMPSFGIGLAAVASASDVNIEF